jgi:hypothetical protein
MIDFLTMKKINFKNLVLGVGLAFTQPIQLPKLHANPAATSVSGLSAGGMMAEQLLIAASDRFIGAAVIAGGIYGCAQNNVITAQTLCMRTPENIQVSQFLKIATTYANKRQIPPLGNLKNKKIFILNGTEDSVVHPVAGQKLLEFSQALIPAKNIATEFDLKAGHGFPTINIGNACHEEASPWLNKCNYDTTQHLLEFIYGSRLRRGKALSKNLFKFNQSEFNVDGSTLANDGYVYIPNQCQNSPGRCGVHVALHGCRQSPLYVQETFMTMTGYNDWAEANGLIILYPVVSLSLNNPKSCFDWWGYTGANYLTRKGPQIESIVKMVDRLTSK